MYKNDKVRTNRVNALFSSIPLISNGVDELKNGEPIPMNQFSVSVSPEGFEPSTLFLVPQPLLEKQKKRYS